MTRMKYTLPALVLLLALVSCRERQIVVRDTIPYVKQIAVDTVDTFELVRTYRTAGTKGSAVTSRSLYVFMSRKAGPSTFFLKLAKFA